MAEIGIQKKQGPGPWPWIIGLVVLAIIVFAVVRMTGDDRDDRALPQDTVGAWGRDTMPGATWDTTPGMGDPRAPGTMPGAAPGTAPGTTPLPQDTPVGVR